MPTQDTNKLKASIAQSWDEASQNYDEYDGHGIRSNEEWSAWKKLASESFPIGARTVLDIGSGTGELCLVFAEMGYQVTGIDISEKMLEKAKAKAHARGLAIDYRIGDAENPPFPDNSFDVVFNRHLLWTLPHPQDALNGWYRVLKPGGQVAIVEGVSNNGSLNHRLRRSVSNWGSTIFDGRQATHKASYSSEMRNALPNNGGTPRERTTEYLTNTGFNNIAYKDIKFIRDIQARHMSFWGRIRRSHYYYLISGEK